MREKILAFLIFLFYCLPLAAHPQETVEERLDRIEAKLDSLLSYYRQESDSTVGDIIDDSLNLLWGIKSPIGTLLDKEYFVINHNNSWKIPYWTAYYLSVSNLSGNQSRTDDFRADPQLPQESRAELDDYKYSGYDRGHNAPAAAFKRNREAMSRTFLLSNMSPQKPNLNRRIWKDLEEEVRDLVQADGEAWVITGNIFMTPDSQSIDAFGFIGAHNVAIPTHCFKAILSTNESGNYSMYAFLIPNQQESISGEPSDYIISIDKLEQITGYDFFPKLDDSIETRLEAAPADVWPR